MKKVRRTAPAGKSIFANLLFDVFDAPKALGVKRDEIIRAEKTIQLFRHEICRAGFFRLDAVND
jgi:hypothetical protein